MTSASGTDPSTTTDASGSSSGNDSMMGSTSMDTSATGMTDLSHDADIQPIWDMYCTLPACHDGATFPPDLTEGNAYASIVGVASSQSDLNFVEPGSADDSYLWHKINGTQVEAGGNGLMMPYDGTEVAAADLAAIEEWINGGAPQ
jgi:hypothetical protein